MKRYVRADDKHDSQFEARPRFNEFGWKTDMYGLNTQYTLT